MSKLAIILLVAGVAAMPFVDRGGKVAMMPLAFGESAEGTPLSNNLMIYVVTSSTGASCRIASEFGQQNGTVLKPDRACAYVYEGLDRVTNWVAGERSNDALKDASGTTILVVGPSDGFAYEAVSDDGTQISFALGEV